MKPSVVQNSDGTDESDVATRLRSLEIDRTQESRPKRRVFLFAFIFLVALALIGTLYVAVSDRAPTDTSTTQSNLEPIIETSKPPAALPAIAPTAEWLVAGYLVARRESLVSAEVTATVAELLVDAGSSVEAGDIIARLDGSLAEADLNIARSRAEAAERTIEAIEADLNEAKAFLERISVLVDDGGVTASDFDKAKARVLSLAAQKRRSEAEHQMVLQEASRAQVFLGKHTITAPFSGVVTSCDVEIGETVSPMSANGSSGVGVCTIVDPTSIEIEIDVPETLIRQISLGSEATAYLDAYSDDPLGAKVISIAPEANREKSTILVRLTFLAPDPRMRPNMAVKVNLERSDTE
ncbi:MAG: efflux RND transporter periplasmic adaptor subunit [Pseudomonadota bacterium]